MRNFNSVLISRKTDDKFKSPPTHNSNYIFAAQVREANRERSLLTNSQKREIGLATMLLCVVAVFFIFNILAMVVNIFEVANILVDEMTRVSNLLVSVNSSVNFVIYCIFGDKFQRLFLRYFCYCYCCCRRRRPSCGIIKLRKYFLYQPNVRSMFMPNIIKTLSYCY